MSASNPSERRRGWREPLRARDLARPPRLLRLQHGPQAPALHLRLPREATDGRARRRLRTITGNLEDARRARARGIVTAGTSTNTVSTSSTAETLHEFAGSWFSVKAATLRPATIEAYDRAYRSRISPLLACLPLVELTRERLEAWLAGLLERDPRRRSIEHAVETLASMLATAVEWHRLETNPAAGLRLPKRAPSTSSSERVLDRAQVEQLLAACGTLRSRTLLRAAVETGMRRGELIGLRWGDVLTSELRLQVRSSVWQGKAGAKQTLSTKSGRARRVAITETLARELEAWRTEAIVLGYPADGYVWPGRAGGSLGADSPGQLLGRVLERAGLVDEQGAGLVGFHGLRHTAASIALSAGVPLITVSRQLGHARVDVTAARYAHLLSDAELDAFGSAHTDTGVRSGVRENPAES